MDSRDVKQYSNNKELKWFMMHHGDHCSICGKEFQPLDSCFSGFISDGRPAVLCSRCTSKDFNVIKRAGFIKQQILLPQPNAKLWRYLNFTRFISLLETGSLFFSRIDKFQDPYEGALGVKTKEQDWLESELKFRRIWVKEKNRNLNLTDEDVEILANEDFEKFRSNARKWRNINYVNCWHMSDCESEAMWRLYAGGEGNGVAIQTTFERLYNALPPDFSGDFGLVNYINYRDYNTGSSGKSIHPFLAPWYKREAFAHEKEFRVKVEDVFNTYHNLSGVNFKVDLSMLIQSVSVSPSAESYFYDLVKMVLKRYNLKIPVLQSEMIEEPLL